ncbi:MAG: CPBP family intramembrane glutamic endopeptidase [Halanaerobiales bacterium]
MVIPLLAVIWYTVFVWQPLSFWLLMPAGILVLVFYSLLLSGKEIFPNELKWEDVLWGLISAFILYIIYLLGYKIGTFFLPSMVGKIADVYALAADYNPLLLAGLMLFIIGPGEEIFWRGFIQQGLAVKYSDYRAFLITAAGYTLVHGITGNWALMGAAAVAGFFWGGLYFWKKSLWIVIISHAFWEVLVLLILPIG